MIKEEPIEEDVDEEEVPARVPAYSIDVISHESAADAQVKQEGVFDWPSKEDADVNIYQPHLLSFSYIFYYYFFCGGVNNSCFDSARTLDRLTD